MPTDVAMQRLQRLAGVGPLAAELILARGAGARDMFPQHEGRLRQAMAALYGTDDPGRLLAIAERWRPCRSWVCVLLRSWFEEQPPGPGRRAGVASMT